MATEPQRDQVVQLVVLRGARQAVGEAALDGIRNLPRWTHPRRVPALADRVVNGRLGHVGVNGAGNGGPLVVLGRGGRHHQPGGEQDDHPTQPEQGPRDGHDRCAPDSHAQGFNADRFGLR
jgi:hypothetical protein